MDIATLLLINDFFISNYEEALIIQQFLKQTITGKMIFMIREHSMSPKIVTVEKWLINYNEIEFFKLFRVTSRTLEKLERALHKIDVNQVLKKKYTGGHYPLELKLQVLIFLYYMATQESLFYIGTRFNISGVSVLNIVNRLLYFVVRLKKVFIRFPSSKEELEQVAKGFKKYQGVVGALDGTHIFINVEKSQQDSYIDRYRRHSINIMAICNSNRLFTYVFIGFPGSAHDSRVFENSQFYRDIERYGPDSIFHDKYHLIGDSAFGIKKWLMTPYRDNQNMSRKERYHNYCLSSERVVIEHTFGQLKGRWRRLQFINTYICKTVEIATAGCILHNFCILNCDIWNEELFFEERVPLPVPGNAGNNIEGQLKRDDIANTLFATRQ